MADANSSCSVGLSIDRSLFFLLRRRHRRCCCLLFFPPCLGNVWISSVASTHTNTHGHERAKEEEEGEKEEEVKSDKSSILPVVLRLRTTINRIYTYTDRVLLFC